MIGSVSSTCGLVSEMKLDHMPASVRRLSLFLSSPTWYLFFLSPHFIRSDKARNLFAADAKCAGHVVVLVLPVSV